MIGKVLLLSGLFIGSAQAAGCQLCDDGSVTWPRAVIESDGTTCQNLSNKMSLYSPTGNDCDRNINLWRNVCCGSEQPYSVPITGQDPSPVYVAASSSSNGRANNQKCNICINGKFPGNKRMMINMLYIGEDTCENYYWAGQRGQIPINLCDPLRYFAYGPCGCAGGYAPPTNNGNGNNNGSGGNNGGGYVRPTQRPITNNGKDNMKLSNNRGGSGGAFHGRRNLLKGE